MKKNRIVFFFTVFSICLYAFPQVYTYDAFRHHERIELREDGTFSYSIREVGTFEEVKGNWQLRNDSILVLDSYPQIQAITIKETSYKGDGTQINVWRADGRPFVGCNIHLISLDNDTISKIVPKEGYLKLRYKIKSFYMTDLFGYKSKEHKLNCINGKKLDIIYNRKRIFENEYWIIKYDYIIPRGKDGGYAKYKMFRNNNKAYKSKIDN